MTVAHENAPQKCEICGEVKPFDDFCFDGDVWGHCWDCFICCVGGRKQLDITARARVMLNGARNRAIRKDVPFDLPFAWVLDRLKNGLCERTGLPFILQGPADIRNPFAPSIDRRTPKFGYTVENCRLVIWGYNVAKGAGTDGDVMIMARALVGLTERDEIVRLAKLAAQFVGRDFYKAKRVPKNLEPFYPTPPPPKETTVTPRTCPVCRVQMEVGTRKAYCSVQCQIKSNCSSHRNEAQCWLWYGAKKSGMPTMHIDGQTESPQRAMYRLNFGEIPEGMTVGTRCFALFCCNPSHLILIPAKKRRASAEKK